MYAMLPTDMHAKSSNVHQHQQKIYSLSDTLMSYFSIGNIIILIIFHTISWARIFDELINNQSTTDEEGKKES